MYYYMEESVMLKKFLLPLLLALCLLVPAFAEEEGLPMVEFDLDGGSMFGGTLIITCLDDTISETGSYGFLCEVEDISALTVGDILTAMEIKSIEPVLEGDAFEGWMIYQLVITEDEDGFSDWQYVRLDELIYSTEDLLALPAPDYYAVYTAKWASVPAESYYSEDAESYEVITVPSITLFANGGVMRIDSEEGPYEATLSVAMAEEGLSFGEVLDLGRLLSVTMEGKTFTGWTVYDVHVLEVSDVPVAEDGVLCYMLGEEWYMVLREYDVCAQNISTEELAGIVCSVTDHVVVANFE